jgi:general secretion pathway protein K
LKDQRGFALVITLLITALLVALSAEFVDEVFVDTSARQNFTDGQQASIMAGSGVDFAIKALQFSLAGRAYNSLADLWAQPFKKDDEKGTLLITVEDESGKVNLNLGWGSNGEPIPPYSDFARRLLKNAGLSLDLLDALADWVDDNNVSPHPAGAKSPYYHTLKPPYDVKSGKLDTVEELRLVKGFDTATVNRLRQFVTVCPDCTTININTAPQEVIAALADDMTSDLAKSVIDYRKTTPFKSVNDLNNVPGMASKIVQSLQAYASVNGTVYRINSSAKVNETTRTVEAVVRSGGQILYWREY